MNYEKFQDEPAFFIKGPSFRYTVTVPLEKIIEYLKKTFGWTTFPQESHLKLAECYDKNIDVEDNHPYVDYLKRTIKDDNRKDEKIFIKSVIASRKKVFNAIKDQRVLSDPTEISICKDGALSYHGYHRTSYAKFLGIKNIRVSFLTLDEDLMQLAMKLFSIYDDVTTLYQPIEHPFFELCHVQHPETKEKAAVIAESIKDKTKKVIEVGAHMGYYSRHLIKNGFDVASVDFDKMMFECQKHLEAIGFQKLDYNNMTIQDYIKNKNGNFTLVAMAIFHTYMREGTWMREALINEIGPWIKSNVSTLIVEHEQSSDKELCDYWKDVCGFKKKKVIFETPKYNRTTYLFEK